MANNLPLREKVDLSGGSWTAWVRAMVPLAVQGNNFRPREDDQDGFICTNIRAALPNEAKHCGIYEWRAKGTLAHQPDYVVYVGSTCRKKPGSLGKRINEYLKHGSHKADLINDALRKRYVLLVRVKISKDRDDAETMENTLLESYNYAWNVRNNGQIRDILPQ